MKRPIFIGVISAALIQLATAFVLSFQLAGQLTTDAPPGPPGGFQVAVKDPSTGYAYFGSSATLIKVRMSDFTEVGRLTVNLGALGGGSLNFGEIACLDPVGGYAYFTTNFGGGPIVRIRLSDFTDAGRLVLHGGSPSGCVIDQPNGLAYFSYGYQPAAVAKVRLSDFSEISDLTFQLNEDGYFGPALPALIDSHGFAYFGIGTSLITADYTQGGLVKIRLSDFTEVGHVIFHFIDSAASPAMILSPGIYDPTTNAIYVGYSDNTNKGQIIKVDLGNFSEVGDLPASGVELTSTDSDLINGFAYFTDIGGLLHRLDLSLFQLDDLSLNTNNEYNVLTDIQDGLAFTSAVTSNQIQRVDLSQLNSMNPSSGIQIGSPVGVTLTGHNFVNGALVHVNNLPPLNPVFLSSTQLQVTIPASDLIGGANSIAVFNPYPGSVGSNPLTFIVTAGPANPSSLSPTMASAGDQDLTLTVNGSGFMDTVSTVEWNTTFLVTTFINPTELTAHVPMSLLQTPGMAQIFVVNNSVPTAAGIFTILAIPGQPQFTHLLPVMGLTDSIGVTATGNPSSFDWILTPETGAGGPAIGSAAVIGRSGNFTLSTLAGTLALNDVPGLGIGSYHIQVFAENALGKRSPRADADVSIIAGGLTAVRVFPNPWISDQHGSFPITFDHLTGNCTVKIFTLSGHWVKTLQSVNGTASWDRTTDSGNHAASGLYFYLITNDQGEKSRGKLSIVK